LAIDRKPIAEWFKEQFEKLRQNIRRPMQPQRKKGGIKL
ncbi:mobilization protein, partial [Bacteroides uniformis]